MHEEKDKNGNVKYICDKCNVQLTQRKDDNLQTFNTRHQQFLDATAAVAPYYREKGLLAEFDASIKGDEFLVAACAALGIEKI
jgi:adenylate kinase family enzyme